MNFRNVAFTIAILAAAPCQGQPVQEARGRGAAWTRCRCDTPRPVGTDGLVAPNTWRDGIVYYKFHPQINATQRQQVLEAMGILSTVSDLTFVERRNEPNYIELIINKKDADSGYSDSIGMDGHRQVVAIGVSVFQLRGLVMHELMHALGFWHEQQRPDRDLYVDVIEERIDPAELHNWNIINSQMEGPYDYASLMHYQPWASSATSDLTLAVRAPYTRAWAYHIGQFTNYDAWPSNGDIWALTGMYGGTPPPRAFLLGLPANAAAVGAAWSPAFTWQASEAATGYRLQVDDTPAFATPVIDIQTTQTTVGGLPALAPDRLYWWRVIASNAQGMTDAFPLKMQVFYTAAQFPATLYVDDSAPAGGNGTSWGQALQDLAVATETAYASGGQATEIRVGAGAYKPAFGSTDRRLSFWLADGCALRGGYAGYGAADPEARDTDLHVTVLSGDLAGDDQPGFVNIDENSFQVVFSLGNPASTLLEGFTITGGKIESAASVAPGIGGGMALDGNATVRRCRFVANHADNFGGGVSVHFSSSDPLFEGCVFEGNRMRPVPEYRISVGGGAAYFHNSKGRFIDCVFTGNTATAAGALCLTAAQPTFVNCVLAGNAATVGGGGAALCSAGSRASLINCSVVGNTSPVGGGAILSDGGSPTAVANSILWGNAPNQVTGPATVVYSDVQGGFVGAGNINQAPSFTNSVDHPYALVAGSPGIDAGSNPVVPAGVVTDLAGAARFLDDPGAANTGVAGGAGGAAIVDMGAYEFDSSPDVGAGCYANCDGSVEAPVLNIGDVVCFLGRFAAGEERANCDRSSAPPVLDVNDFTCFINRYAAGCP